MARDLEAIDYRVRWRGSDVHAGSQRSRIAGSGDGFRGVAPLTQGRDARRIDLRASITDPWGRPWVREFHQRSRVPVLLLADLSDSMRFEGRAERFQMAERFARALARGAWRNADPFGFIGCGRTVQRALTVPPSISRQAGDRVVRQLSTWRANVTPGQPTTATGGSSADGLADAARFLPQRRSLLFLLSDLYLPDALFERVLRSLRGHELVVVLLADSAERAPPARWGLVRLADLETGRERLLLLRPGLAERMAAQQTARIAHATQRARHHGAALLVAEDALDLAAIARHFLRSRSG